MVSYKKKYNELLEKYVGKTNKNNGKYSYKNSWIYRWFKIIPRKELNRRRKIIKKIKEWHEKEKKGQKSI